MFRLYALVCLVSLSVFCDAAIPKYKTGYFEQNSDHFNDMNYAGKTFKQKYLIGEEHWKSHDGPIFFYTGNEAPIEAFWNSAGFVHELAAQMGGLVIFAEHRFYGESLPYGNNSLTKPYLGTLNMEQALADFALLINEIILKRNATHAKVITVGGSYGGMLAVYMRFKYPNLVHGAYAASAPIYMQDPSNTRDFFYPMVTKVYKETSDIAYHFIQKIWSLLRMFHEEGPMGYKALKRYFKVCDDLKSEDDFVLLLQWITHGLSMMAVENLPYASEHLPAYPVKAACDAIRYGKNPIYGLSDAISIYYNRSSNSCLPLYKSVECADPTGCGLGTPSGIAWDYQACTEMLLPSGSNGKTDMFFNLAWSQTKKAKYCLKKFGVIPNYDWPSVQYWGEQIKSSSNIIFTNGDRDPWMGGGVLKSVSDSIVSIMIKGAAHHYELRASNKADSQDIVKAREQIAKTIAKWVGKK